MENNQNQNFQKANQPTESAKDQPKNDKNGQNSKKGKERSDQPEKVLKYNEAGFKFDENTVERISTFFFYKSVFKKVKVSFLEDLATFMTVPRGRIIN
jgi:hypothetical protein